MDCAAPASFTHPHADGWLGLSLRSPGEPLLGSPGLPLVHPPFPPSGAIGGGPKERGSPAFYNRATPSARQMAIGGRGRIPREICTS